MLSKIIVQGLVSGGIYAVLAVGFSLIFGVGKILNMAHTAFYMVSAYIIFYATSMLGLPLPASLTLAIILTTVLGIACYILFFNPI